MLRERVKERELLVGHQNSVEVHGNSSKIQRSGESDASQTWSEKLLTDVDLPSLARSTNLTEVIIERPLHDRQITHVHTNSCSRSS